MGGNAVIFTRDIMNLLYLPVQKCLRTVNKKTIPRVITDWSKLCMEHTKIARLQSFGPTCREHLYIRQPT